MSPPWIVHEDEDLLVVDKPSGVNTHRPDLHAQQGFYEWVAARSGVELSLLHRLDKGTSGLLLLGKTQRAAQSLNAQLGERRLKKRYRLLVAHDARRPDRLRCDARVPQKKRRGPGSSDQEAVTEFERIESGAGYDLFEARPLTGRTHQIRLHATRLGMPIVGDGDYAGPPGARLFLHAHGVALERPGGGAPLELTSPLPDSFGRVLAGEPPHGPRVAAQAALDARARLIDAARTDAYLWIDRGHDGFPDLRVERLGRVGLALRYDEGTGPLSRAWTQALLQVGELSAVVEQRRPRGGGAEPAALVAGELGARRFEVQELGLRYLIDLDASVTSSGLFLDQRETRRRLLAMDLRGKRVLNGFAHTGSLSVAAARAGAETLTLDLSKRYLDWARDNLRLNGIDPAEHDFIYGDALDWLRRLENKGRRFELVLLDPPSFSTRGKGRRRKRWSVERDLGELVARGARLVAPGGTLFVSTNLRRMPWARFLERIAEGVSGAGRRGDPECATLPLDHRSGAGDPPYLKAAWVSLD